MLPTLDLYFSCTNQRWSIVANVDEFYWGNMVLIVCVVKIVFINKLFFLLYNKLPIRLFLGYILLYLAVSFSFIFILHIYIKYKTFVFKEDHQKGRNISTSSFNFSWRFSFLIKCTLLLCTQCQIKIVVFFS